MYKHIVQPALFAFNPEKAHSIAMQSALLLSGLPLGKSILHALSGFKHTDDPVSFMGLHFRNRFGMAAGFDKNGQYVTALQNMGFGHVEVGTVTPRPQPGNPKPRLFRLKDDYALINRMGFNNEGVHSLFKRLEQLPPDRPIIGGNIGKNKDTPNDEAWNDFVYCTRVLYDVVDYFTVNVSSPNTPGLRALQEKAPLIKILSEIQNFNQGTKNPRPVLLKVSPDNSPEVYEDIVDVCIQCNITGIIATNTTVDRDQLNESEAKLENIGAGGLSGRPLRLKSLQVASRLRSLMPDNMILVGVGGISQYSDAQAMQEAGASLLQLYTGFIYKGPSIVSRLMTE